jgi:hypothetical protein
MKIVSEINSSQDLDEMKTVMEIFIVKNRVRQLAEMA